MLIEVLVSEVDLHLPLDPPDYPAQLVDHGYPLTELTGLGVLLTYLCKQNRALRG